MPPSITPNPTPITPNLPPLPPPPAPRDEPEPEPVDDPLAPQGMPVPVREPRAPAPAGLWKSPGLRATPVARRAVVCHKGRTISFSETP